MKFAATDYHPSGGEYVEIFEAETWQAARAYCRENGLLLDGEVEGPVLSYADMIAGTPYTLQ